MPGDSRRFTPGLREERRELGARLLRIVENTGEIRLEHGTRCRRARAGRRRRGAVAIGTSSNTRQMIV
jgi:hypothetical protein